MDNIFTAKDKQYGFAEQSTFGTAEIDGAAVVLVDTEHFNIEPDIKYRVRENSVATRNQTDGDVVVDVKGSSPSFTSANLAKLTELDFFLYAHFQNVVEALTPFGKTFTFPATQPDLSADAGFFATWFERYQASTTSWKVLDAISKQLTISGEPGDDQRLKVSQEWMSRGVPSDSFTSNPSGTWTRSSNQFFYIDDIARATIDFGAGAVGVSLTGSFEVVLTQDVIPVGQDGSGSFENFAIVNRVNTFKITILKGAASETAFANWKAGTAIDVNLGWGNVTPGTDSGDLDITYHGKIEKCVVNNGDVQGVEITGTILALTRTSEPITILIANGIDRSW